MMLKSKWILWVVIVASSLFNVSCEDDDDNKLASAQECFDNLPDSAPDAAAQACEAKIAGLTSPESYVLRCSVRFFLGGVKTTNIIAAFDAMEGASSNLKAATLMTKLKQTNLTFAESTRDACKQSQVSSLDFLATVSFTGTAMLDGTGATFVDINNPTSGEITAMLSDCASGGCNNAAIGTAVVSMYDSYCLGDTATTPVCSDIYSAIQTGGGDPATIADKLFDYLQN